MSSLKDTPEYEYNECREYHGWYSDVQQQMRVSYPSRHKFNGKLMVSPPYCYWTQGDQKVLVTEITHTSIPSPDQVKNGHIYLGVVDKCWGRSYTRLEQLNLIAPFQSIHAMPIKLKFKFKLIAAMCSDGGIGYNGQLPWPHCKADMAHFAKRTIGAGNNAIIMGKKTWESIPARPLKRRANLILSSQIPNRGPNHACDAEHWFASMADLFAHLESAKYDEVWIIGGASIYEQFLAMHKNGEINIDEMCITTMEGAYECDTFFPLHCINNPQ